jgi:tetratricopeptide (TPR) repeat protein
VRVLIFSAALSWVAVGALAGPKSRPVPSDSPSPAFVQVPELGSGFDLLYNQKFPEAREKFTHWVAGHPEEPFGQIAIAASFLFDEFYRQGVLTSDFFLNDKKFLRGIEGKPDPGRLEGFQTAIERARTLAREHLKKDPHDADALFALTLAAGMESDSQSILERRHLDSLKRMREANDFAKQTLALRPDAADVYIAPGSANYIIGCLSGGARFVLWFGGIHGDKKMGMDQLQKTAENGRYLKPFAKVMLALAALREKQTPLAQKLLEELVQQYPDSPLFTAEYAKVAGRPLPAVLNPR